MEKKINMEYNIPYYIFEEMWRIYRTNCSGKCKKATWENIKSLLNLAVINERLTREQANNLIETYCREK